MAALPQHGFHRPGWQGSRGPGWAPVLTFWWFQALGARGLEPSEGPFDHLLVLHLHGLGSVALIAVMARWEQLPGSAAGHLGGNMHGGLEGQAGGQTPRSEGGRRCKEGEDWRRTPEECRKEARKMGGKGVHRPGRRTLCPGLTSAFRLLGQLAVRIPKGRSPAALRRWLCGTWAACCRWPGGKRCRRSSTASAFQHTPGGTTMALVFPPTLIEPHHVPGNRQGSEASELGPCP